MKPYLSVIIPAYNEIKRLSPTLIDIDKQLSKADFTYEIIMVDNNSTDGTLDMAERMETLIKNLKVIECITRGKAAAVKMGMLEAQGEVRLFMDADNSTNISEFYKMIPLLKEGYQVVIASRDVKGAKKIPPQPWYKTLAGDMGNLVIQTLLLPGIWDTQCGFKAFTKEAAEKIFPLIRTKKWSFDVELLALSKKFGYKIKEIPITWVNNADSKVKLTSYFGFLWDVFKIKWWFMTGQYNNKKDR